MSLFGDLYEKCPELRPGNKTKDKPENQSKTKP